MESVKENQTTQTTEPQTTEEQKKATVEANFNVLNEIDLKKELFRINKALDDLKLFQTRDADTAQDQISSLQHNAIRDYENTMESYMTLKKEVGEHLAEIDDALGQMTNILTQLCEYEAKVQVWHEIKPDFKIKIKA